MTVTSDDPKQPNLAIKLSGTGVAPSAPLIKVTVPTSDFGTVNVNTTKDIVVTVANTGTVTLNVTASFTPAPPFSIVQPGLTFTVPAGGSQPLTLRFAPTTAAAATGTLTLTSNDLTQTPLTFKFTGAGAGPATQDVVLKVDGGIFNAEVGYDTGVATAYFVNRLTPPSYPATLKSVQIFFSTRSDGVALGSPLFIFAASNPHGSPTLSLSDGGASSFVQTSVAALDTLVTYNVPARTITSGDFVVGFMVSNPPNVYPADLDLVSPSQNRSYGSTDGVNFVLLAPGNLAIRAVVTVGGSN
jgi:hypothetical protein